MTKYFKQLSTGLILKAERKELIEQYEKHTKAYQPVDPSEIKPKATTKAPTGGGKSKTGKDTTSGENEAPDAPNGATTGDGK